jgi:hypothetical protein
MLTFPPMQRFVTTAALLAVLAASGVARAQDPNQGTDMQAGGLRPPPPEQTEESARTEENLQKADQEDSGRGLEFFYVNVEGGVQHVGLQTLSSDNMIDSSVAKTTQTGPMLGAGLGVRLLFITVGPRFRYAHFSDFNMWTLGAEVAMRFPLGNIEPYAMLGGGYASIGSKSDVVNARGLDVRVGGGLDYYVTPVFSIGANVTADLLALSRSATPPVNAAGTPGTPGTVNYAADGSSVGMGIAGTAVVGLHF